MHTRFALSLAALSLGSTLAHADLAIGVSFNNELVTFQTDAPQWILSTIPITGIAAGPADPVFDVAYDRSTETLYGVTLGLDLYAIAPDSGAATLLGSALDLGAFFFGSDLTLDASGDLRFLTDGGDNSAIDLSGAVTTDTPLFYGLTDPNNFFLPGIDGAATSGQRTYVIDSALDVLAFSDDIAGGELTTIGPLGISGGNPVGFDIFNGTGYLSYSDNGGFNAMFYEVDLSTGAATPLGSFAGPLQDFAIVPEPRLLPVALALVLGLLFWRRRSAR